MPISGHSLRVSPCLPTRRWSVPCRTTLRLKYLDWHKSVLQMWLESSKQTSGSNTYLYRAAEVFSQWGLSFLLNWSLTWSPGLSQGPATGPCQWRPKYWALCHDGGKVNAPNHNPFQTGGHDHSQQDDAGHSKAIKERRWKSEPSEAQGNSEKVPNLVTRHHWLKAQWLRTY